MAKEKVKREKSAKLSDNNGTAEVKARWSGNWDKWGKQDNSGGGMGGAVYGLGIIGAFVYWMQAAGSFGAVITGILKAIVWPAYFVYKFLEYVYGIA